MPNIHCYIGIENLALNVTQRQTLINGLRALGPAADRSPAHLNHWRTRLDNDAAIFEALFDEDDISVAGIKSRLAALFGVDPGDISHSTGSQSFGGGTTTIATFTYSGTDYLRLALFGGPSCTWPESGDECRGYLSTYAAEWESEP